MFLEDFEFETDERSIGDRLSELENLTDLSLDYWDSQEPLEVGWGIYKKF